MLGSWYWFGVPAHLTAELVERKANGDQIGGSFTCADTSESRFGATATRLRG